MDHSVEFVEIAGLMSEPNRARMLWALLDGRAYTATELSIAADISVTSASNHLTKLLQGGFIKVETQGRHRYFRFANDDVAHVIESMACLAKPQEIKDNHTHPPKNEVQYCRTCYDHLAGYVGVCITQAMIDKGILTDTEDGYHVTDFGWERLAEIGVDQVVVTSSKRPVTRKCLDWSERKHHLAGALGAALLTRMLELDWIRRKQFTRAILITPKGYVEMEKIFGVVSLEGRRS